MSLFKQLLIIISVFFLMIFSVNFALSVRSIKSYLEVEAQGHAQDTATSLGLSLSPYITNTKDPIIKTMVSAIFDRGYYKEIRLIDANKKEIVSLNNDKGIEGVPSWFINYLSMSTFTAESEISSGWTISGVVYVTINPSFAYNKLYEQAKFSLYYALTTFAVSIVLLVLLLRITLASLKRINQLALRVSEGHFETIESLPWTSEIKNVTVSFNMMSRKIESTITSLNNKLNIMGAVLLRDDLCGLYKKGVFETDIKSLLQTPKSAYLMLIKLDSLPDLVKEVVNAIIDQLLQAVAEKLKKTVERHPETSIKIYRLYGGEFAILIYTASLEQIKLISAALSGDLEELGEQYSLPDLAHVGVVPVNPVHTTDMLLESAYEAYEQARLIGANRYYIRSNENFARDISAWKELVINCVDNADYSLSYTGQIISFQTGQLMMEEAFSQVYDKSGQLVAIGPFISIAEKINKIVDLDKGVIGKVIDHIISNQIQHAVAVNLALSTIKNASFRLWLEKLNKNNPAVTKQLVFCFSAYAVAKHEETYLDFIQIIHQWGGRVMIKRFETQSMSLEMTKELNPDFIMLAREIGEGISHSRQKYEFVQAMQQIGVLLDITIFAENVQADDDYKSLMTIGVAGVSR